MTISLQAVRVDKSRTAPVMKVLKGHLLDRPRCKSVWPDPDSPTHRLVLLHERYTATGTCTQHTTHGVPPLHHQEGSQPACFPATQVTWRAGIRPPPLATPTRVNLPTALSLTLTASAAHSPLATQTATC